MPKPILVKSRICRKVRFPRGTGRSDQRCSFLHRQKRRCTDRNDLLGGGTAEQTSRGLVVRHPDALRIWEKARPDSRHVRCRGCTASHRFRDRVLASSRGPSRSSQPLQRRRDPDERLQTKPLDSPVVSPVQRAHRACIRTGLVDDLAIGRSTAHRSGCSVHGGVDRTVFALPCGSGRDWSAGSRARRRRPWRRLQLSSLSAVHIEAAWWYSASSFAWAMLGTLLAWLCVLRSLSLKRPRSRWGPSAGGWRRPWRPWRRRRARPLASWPGLWRLSGLCRILIASRSAAGALVGLIPLAGTVLYLVIASQVRYFAILTHSVDRNLDIRTGSICTLRAPFDVLAAGLIGLDNADRWQGGGLDLVLAALLLDRRLAWGRSPCGHFCSAAWLMLGGYALTYSVRNLFGPHWLMEVQRYHLFPQLGFVLVLARVSRPGFTVRCAAAIHTSVCDGPGLPTSGSPPTDDADASPSLPLSRPGADPAGSGSPGGSLP